MPIKPLHFRPTTSSSQEKKVEDIIPKSNKDRSSKSNIKEEPSSAKKTSIASAKNTAKSEFNKSTQTSTQLSEGATSFTDLPESKKTGSARYLDTSRLKKTSNEPEDFSYSPLSPDLERIFADMRDRSIESKKLRNLSSEQHKEICSPSILI